MLKYKISWKVLKNVLIVILSFYGKVKFAFCSFLWEEFMHLINKYTEIGEHKNTFLALEAKIIL